MDKELEKLIRSDLHRLGIKNIPAFGNGLPLQARYLILWRKAAYYYKKGGSLGCGCKKKMEEGGQTPKKSPVDKFRNAWTKKDE